MTTTIIFSVGCNEFWEKCIYTASYANKFIIFNFVATFLFIDCLDCCNFFLIWERIVTESLFIMFIKWESIMFAESKY